MASYNNPPYLAPATQFPIQVLNFEQFQDLLNSFKRDFFDVLVAEGQMSCSKTVQVLETTTTKVGNFILKRTDRVVTDPEDLPIPAFDPNEYTLQDLWSVLSKRGKYRKLRALLMGRSIKNSFSTIIVNKMSKTRHLRPVINREDVAKWLVIRKVIFEALTTEQMADWCLLSGIMVVSQGGKLLNLSSTNIEEESKNQSRFSVPVISNQPSVQPTPTPAISELGPPMRPANIPRVQRSVASSTPLTVLEERVQLLERAAVIRERVAGMGSGKHRTSKAPNLRRPPSELEVDLTSSIDDEFEYAHGRVDQPWDGESSSDGIGSNSDGRSSAHDYGSRVNWVAFCT